MKDTTPSVEPVPFDYNVYPNPVKDDLNVDLHCLKRASMQFSLFTLNNLRVYQSVKECQQGHSTITIPMSGMQKGEYFLHISCGEKTVVEIIIKN